MQIIYNTDEFHQLVKFDDLRIGDIFTNKFHDTCLKTTHTTMFNFSNNKEESIFNMEYECWLLNAKLIVQR